MLTFCVTIRVFSKNSIDNRQLQVILATTNNCCQAIRNWSLLKTGNKATVSLHICTPTITFFSPSFSVSLSLSLSTAHISSHKAYSHRRVALQIFDRRNWQRRQGNNTKARESKGG